MNISSSLLCILNTITNLSIKLNINYYVSQLNHTLNELFWKMLKHPNEQVAAYGYRILECYGAGMDFNHHLVPTTPDMSGDTFHSTRFLKALPSLALDNVRVGISTTSLRNLVQRLATLNKKKIFLKYILNF